MDPFGLDPTSPMEEVLSLQTFYDPETSAGISGGNDTSGCDGTSGCNTSGCGGTSGCNTSGCSGTSGCNTIGCSGTSGCNS
jgi:hypothetical protein